MLEIKEQGTLPFEESTQPLEEISKYHKRIDDLIEDAEIEAEMEAEKKIRSKNSRMFSISMIGIGLLGLVYFQVNHQTTATPVKPAEETQIKKPETAEESLARQVPVVEDGSSASNIPIAQSSGPAQPIVESNPFITPPKIKSTKPKTKSTKTESTKPKSKNTKAPAKIKQVKKSSQVKKVDSNAKSKSSSKKATSATKSKSSRFYIQAGAFSIRKNAKFLSNQLTAKGFSPSIHTLSQKSNRHVVTVGNFANKKSGDDTLRELTRNGFNASYYKNPKNSFSLKIGQFNSLKDAQKEQDRLSVKGFLSESHKADVPVETYMVQLGVFPNREKALLTKEKLARAGFPKTFLR
jgi:cell division protein FtsN